MFHYVKFDQWSATSQSIACGVGFVLDIFVDPFSKENKASALPSHAMHI